MKTQFLLRAAAAAAFLSLAFPLSRTAIAQTPQFQPGDFNVHTTVQMHASGNPPLQHDKDFSTVPAADVDQFNQNGTVGLVTATAPPSLVAQSAAHAADPGPTLLSNETQTTVTTRFYLIPHAGYALTTATISIDYLLTGSVEVTCDKPCGQDPVTNSKLKLRRGGSRKGAV